MTLATDFKKWYWLDLTKFKFYISIIFFYYPLTFLGTLTLIFSLALLGYSFSTSNLYALLISIFVLSSQTALILFTRFWYLRQSEVEITWDSGLKLVSRSEDAHLQIKINASTPPYFFRYHAVLFAKLIVGRAASLYYFMEASSSAAGEVHLQFYLPLSGTLEIKNEIVLKDILGLTRTRIGKEQRRSFPIRVPLLEEKIFLPRFSANTLESQKRQRQSEEEKYYMREYIPGDRIKDINWKSSLRIGDLVTRIAPQSPEQSPLICIEFRNISMTLNDSYKSLLHLNILKSWLYSFIVHLRRSESRYKFFVQTAQTEFVLNTEQDIENFASILGGLQYVSKKSWVDKSPSVLEKFIFTTMFDPTLRDLKQSLSQNLMKTNIFQVVSRKAIQANKKTPFSRVRLFELEKIDFSFPIPREWIYRREPKKLPKLALQPLKTGVFHRQMIIETSIF